MALNLLKKNSCWILMSFKLVPHFWSVYWNVDPGTCFIAEITLTHFFEAVVGWVEPCSLQVSTNILNPEYGGRASLFLEPLKMNGMSNKWKLIQESISLPLPRGSLCSVQSGFEFLWLQIKRPPYFHLPCAGVELVEVACLEYNCHPCCWKW